MTREELLKIAKPMLFNADMVRAILDGRKTATRRVNKDINEYTLPDMGFYNADRRTYAIHNYADLECTDKVSIAERKCPICPGDIIYVRESVFQGVRHCFDANREKVNVLTNVFEYYADGILEKDHWKDIDGGIWMHRRPSIHMPKEAARIFLKVKDVRVERLQDITTEQILSEGIKVSQFDLPNTGIDVQFRRLWDSTIKKSDLALYGWNANPWVWTIEFERIEVDE